MAKVLDLNSAQHSIMDLTLSDDARTVVHLDYPSEALVQELETMQGQLNGMAKGDRAAVERIYDLAASLINCNLDLFVVTGEELRTVYKMHALSAVKFFSSYLDAIEELRNSKN